MPYTLTDFLVSLAEPESHKAFSMDPEGYMIRAGLNERQREAIRHGNIYAVRRLAAEEMKDESLQAQVVNSVYQEVDPDFVRMSLGHDDNPAVETNADFDVQSVDNDITANDSNVHVTDLGDDIAEFTPSYSSAHYYDHLFDDVWVPKKSSELIVVGTGINGANHLTSEAVCHIRNAGKVLYCVADLVVERKIRTLNTNTENLYHLYGDDKPRQITYQEMVEHIISALGEYEKVCAVFYGHPGIFVWPSYRAIQRARKDGIKAFMLPAVSALDCLFADVGFDPSRYSCQIFEATDLLIRSKKIDTSASVIIFQIGCVGDLGFRFRGYDRRNVPILSEYLASFYGDDYEVILYEAAQYPICPPRLERVSISGLADAKPTGITTLYIPPKHVLSVNRDMLLRLDLKGPKYVE
jgi:precorrin-6B methylase 1